MKKANTYLYLSTILEKGSFTEAAKTLFIAQPSLSQYVKRIEQEVGTELFIRNSTPLQLTEAGKIYMDAEKTILNIKSQVDNQILEILEMKRGQITIGSSHYRSMFLLTKAIPEFKAKYPQIEIKLEEGGTEYLEDCAVNGTTDFSIVLLPLKHAELTYDILFEEEILIAMSPVHPLAQHIDLSIPQQPPYPVLDFSLLQNESFIIMKKGQNLRRSFFELCQISNIQPPIVMQTDDMPTAQSLAATGIGVTIVPDQLVKSNLYTVAPFYFSIKQKIPKRKVVVVYSSLRPMSKAAKAFWETLKETVTE